MSKLDQLRALRAARYRSPSGEDLRYERPKATVTKPPRVTKEVRDMVDALMGAVVDLPPEEVERSKTGRPRLHPSGAAKQRAYRQRKKGTQNV